MPLLRPKSSAPNSSSVARRRSAAIGPSSGGWFPSIAKKTCAATQSATVTAAMLNSTRSTERLLLSIRADSTRPSRAAVIAPADGPNSSVAAILNVSEIEKLMGMLGMRSVAHPLATVSPTRINHSSATGCLMRS